LNYIGSHRYFDCEPPGWGTISDHLHMLPAQTLGEYIYAHGYICIYIYVYICICIYTCTYISKYICIYSYINICVYICIYIFMGYSYGSLQMLPAQTLGEYIYTHGYICIYIYICICIYTCTYISIYVCIYSYINTCVYICIYIFMGYSYGSFTNVTRTDIRYDISSAFIFVVLTSIMISVSFHIDLIISTTYVHSSY
jgi:hypothetical protein